MNLLRRDVDDHADGLELERCVHADACRTGDARLEAAARDRDAVTDFKAGLLALRSANLWIVLGAFAFMAGIAWFVMSSNSEEASGKQLVATLNPANFEGRAREAYQAARDIPEVLADLPCFCGCAVNAGHKSNLFCFKDRHGEECAMCQDIALVARAMHDQGNSVEKIRDEIIARYSQYAP